MKLAFALLLLLLLAVGQRVGAQVLDLTNGLGQFTWGMQFADAVKIADATYGAADVNISTPRTDSKPLVLTSRMKPSPSAVPIPNPIHVPPPKVEPPQTLQDQSSSITITHDGLKLLLEFFHGKLFQIVKTVKLPISGYVTQQDLDAADLGKQARAMIKVSPDMGFSANFSPGDHDTLRGITVFTTGTISFVAEKSAVLDAEFAALRAKNPDLKSLFLKPLLTP